MFVRGKPFLLSVMVASKAIAYLSGAPEKYFIRVCSGLAREHYTRVERHS
jgi:hypothetical protein